ncbi:uncharacterized protein LOC141573958 [Camelus bactrianus]|uniref:Uncharacterized protein LOC141573958 n=1 Tax=Camelus bactrianus TaxID=9837 RepID=A0AC58NYU8_CAMBA
MLWCRPSLKDQSSSARATKDSILSTPGPSPPQDRRELVKSQRPCPGRAATGTRRAQDATRPATTTGVPWHNADWRARREPARGKPTREGRTGGRRRPGNETRLSVGAGPDSGEPGDERLKRAGRARRGLRGAGQGRAAGPRAGTKAAGDTGARWPRPGGQHGPMTQRPPRGRRRHRPAVPSRKPRLPQPPSVVRTSQAAPPASGPPLSPRRSSRSRRQSTTRPHAGPPSRAPRPRRRERTPRTHDVTSGAWTLVGRLQLRGSRRNLSGWSETDASVNDTATEP